MSTGTVGTYRKRNATRKKTIERSSSKSPIEGGIVKKKTKSNHRLYPGIRSKKSKKEESNGPSSSSKEEEEEGRGGERRSKTAKKSKNNSVHRRNKIWWYQCSKKDPTSRNTLKKGLCQMFNIMKDAKMFQRDEDLENPNKKVRVLSATSASKNRRGKNKRNEKGGSIVDKFSISKEALEGVHILHTYYMGEILKTGQEICQNVQKMTVTPDILDLVSMITNKQMGPKWNMQMIPNDGNATSTIAISQ
jgi:hypothetical protein